MVGGRDETLPIENEWIERSTRKSKEASNHFLQDEQGQTVLHERAREGDLEAVEKIIFSLMGTGIWCQRYGLIGTKDNSGKTATDLARENGHDEVANLLQREWTRMHYFE